jgi:hypothetical protein
MGGQPHAGGQPGEGATGVVKGGGGARMALLVVDLSGPTANSLPPPSIPAPPAASTASAARRYELDPGVCRAGW